MDRLIAYTAITAARVVTLPAATAYPPGARLMIVDESRACSASNTITVSPAGAHKIDGQASVVINSSYGYVGMESNGSNSWTVIENGATIARAPHGGNAQFAIMEFTPPGLSGPTVTYTPSITQNCIVFAVSVRVLTAISGCSSWDLGNSGASSTQYGSGLGLTVNTTNAGVAAPTPFFPAPTLTFTAVGGAASFSGNGTVRLSILLMFVNPPTA
jgi:hypothetical protein